MNIGILFVVLFGTLIIGVPLALGLAFTSMVFIIFFSEVPLIIIVQRIFAGTDSFTLTAAPLFILAALLMHRAGISEKIMILSSVLVGRIKGSLASVNIVSSMFFAGISGTATADTACVGGLLIPAMRKKGYPDAFTASVTAASSTIGIIIPPSVPMIYYWVLTGLSISTLFIAGLVPGILIGIAMIITSTIIAYRNDFESSDTRYSLMDKIKAIFGAWAPLGMILIILGGILGGFFTPTEAAGVAAIYALIIGLFVTRKLKIRELPEVLVDAGVMTGSVMIIIAVADLLGWVITYARIPAQLVVPLISSFQGSPEIFMWFVSFILIITGTFLHGIAMLVVVVPLFFPTMVALAIDPLQFAMVVIMCWGIGQQTPPVGSALYICCQMAEVDMYQITKANLPFIAVLLFILGLIIQFPAIVTWLPGLMR
jgi:C4-dicarboxylate transporter DctM subunit